MTTPDQASPVLLWFVFALIGTIGLTAVFFGLADLYRRRQHPPQQPGEPDEHYRQRLRS